MKIEENSIGTPEVILELVNTSGRTIDAFKVGFSLYNNYDEPVRRYGVGTNQFSGISQDDFEPGKCEEMTWTLYGHDTATKVKNVKIHSIHFKK